MKKTYTLTITQDDEGKLLNHMSSEGFTYVELLGLLLIELERITKEFHPKQDTNE